jgi:hypothetical protein
MKRFGWVAVLLIALVLNRVLPAAGQGTAEGAKPASVTNAGPRLFQFAGGDFNQFLTKLRSDFGKEVYEMIEIRGDAGRIRVPKMKLSATMRDTFFANAHELAIDIREVLASYNRISNEGDGFLGKWIYSPAAISIVNYGRQPETIIFLPPKGGGSDGTAGIQVRAFSIRGMSPDATKALEDLIRQESRQLQQEIVERSGDPASAEGRVNIHQGTALLIASGGKTYVDLVSTLMDAFVTKERLMGDALKNAGQEKKPAPVPQADPKVAKPQ